MSATVKEVARTLRHMKVRDVPDYVKTNFHKDKLAQTWDRLMEEYHNKYIRTSSIEPLHHILWSVGITGYLVGLPTELRHLRREEEARLLGKGHH